MTKLSILLCLLALPAHATEPPDWYAHIPTEQRAALLAARDVQRGHAALAVPGVHGYRGAASGAYSAPAAQFDASALVHPPRYDLLYRLRLQDRERRMLWAYRQPDGRPCGNALTTLAPAHQFALRSCGHCTLRR